MKKKKTIILFSICCALLVIFSYTLLREDEAVYFIEGDSKNLYFAYYVEDQITTEMPKKDSGYTLSSESTCTNGVTLSFDVPTWTVKVDYSNFENESNSRTKCNLHFRKMTFAESVIACTKMGTNTTKCMNDYQELEDHLAYDDTVDHNLRYIGSIENNPLYDEESEEAIDELIYIRNMPNNYVDLGEVYSTDIYVHKLYMRHFISYNERYNSLEECIKDGGTEAGCIKVQSAGDKLLWRIIGVMNNIEDENGEKSSRIKLVRDYYTESVVWERYVPWEGSVVETNLNTTYFNSLPSETQEKIGMSVWQNGMMALTEEDRPSWNGTNSSKSIAKWYEAEHGELVSEYESSTWTGRLGILKASDVGYAMPLESILGDSCTNLDAEFEDLEIECLASNWLMESLHYAWLMNLMEYVDEQLAYNLLYRGVFMRYDISGLHISRLNEDGLWSDVGRKEGLEVYPTLYLDSDVKIIAGDGSKDSPFQISID